MNFHQLTFILHFFGQLKTLTNKTNNDESKDIYIKNVRELGSSLIYRRTTFVPNTTPLIKEYKENYDDLILLRKELIPKIKSNEEIINKNKAPQVVTKFFCERYLNE